MKNNLKNGITTCLLTLTLLTIQTSLVSAADPVYSLRGDIDIDDLSEMIPNRRAMAVDGGISVTFEYQPPLIPHSIDKTRITLHENSCLNCHSKKNYKETNAVRPPKSHYYTRKDTKLSEISTKRA